MSGYGPGGTLAVGTPQANPTVEAEFAILLPPDVLRVTTRLRSTAEAAEVRLRDYIERIDDALASFDTLRPAAFGFACTASSYLVGAEREAALVAAASARFGYPVVTAAAAITAQLQAIGARRIALVSPYPPALGEAALAYWRAAGFLPELSGTVAIPGTDTRGIYALRSSDAQSALDHAAQAGADAILITGTGMPSLPLIAAAPDGPPVLSSNLALAIELLKLVGRTLPDWRPALAAAIGEPT